MTNINASIIDQRLLGIQEEIREQASTDLGIKDSGRLKSLAFLYLCVRTLLDLDVDETFDCLTEGGGDFGIEASIGGLLFVVLMTVLLYLKYPSKNKIPQALNIVI